MNVHRPNDKEGKDLIVCVDSYLHNHVDIGRTVHAVMHSDEVRVMKSRQLPQDLDFLHKDFRGFLNSFLCDHLNSYRLGRILWTRHGYLRIFLVYVPFFIVSNCVNKCSRTKIKYTLFKLKGWGIRMLKEHTDGP